MVTTDTVDRRAIGQRIEAVHTAWGFPYGSVGYLVTSRWGRHWVQVWQVHVGDDAWYYRVSDLREEPELFARWRAAGRGQLERYESERPVFRHPWPPAPPHPSILSSLAHQWLVRHPDALARKVAHEHRHAGRPAQSDLYQLARVVLRQDCLADVWVVEDVVCGQWIYRVSNTETQSVLIAELDGSAASAGYRVHALLLEPLAGRKRVGLDEWAAYAADWLRFSPELGQGHVLERHFRFNEREPTGSVRCVARAATSGNAVEVWAVEEETGT